MSDIQSWIWVTFEKEGIHRYPEAAKIEGAEFLQYPHRHIFKFRVWLEVKHDNRDVEFILFKRWLQSQYESGVLESDYKSCEMMARDLIAEIVFEFPNRKVKVEVSEDGENGALLETV